MPETATELITGGVAPWTCGANVEFQKCQIRLQIEKEKVFEQAACTMPVEKVLIVCDRGILDNKAYMDDIELNDVYKDLIKLDVEDESRKEFVQLVDTLLEQNTIYFD